MRWRMYTLIALVTLMVTAVPALKIKAQGLVEYARILVVVGVGSDEVAEIHWLPKSNRGTSQGTNAEARLFKHDYTFSIPAINASDPACTQTFEASVEPHTGLNILQIAKTGGDLLVNGEFVGVFDGCFTGANRIVYQVGIPVPPGFIQQENPDPNTLALKANNVQITSYSIVGSDGGTRATGLPAGEYTLRVAGILN